MTNNARDSIWQDIVADTRYVEGDVGRVSSLNCPVDVDARLKKLIKVSEFVQMRTLQFFFHQKKNVICAICDDYVFLFFLFFYSES